MSARARPGRVVFAGLSFAMAIAGCSALGLDDDPTAREELEAARLTWEQHGFEDYDMHLESSCFGSCGPAIVKVRANSVVAVVDLRTGENISSPVPPNGRVESLFDLVAEAIDLNSEVLEVEYDRGSGYPTLIRIDIRRDMADDELLVRVLEVAPNDAPLPYLRNGARRTTSRGAAGRPG